jgi:HK97 family phage portal protein
MGLFGFDKKTVVEPTRKKTFITEAEAVAYANGGNTQTVNRSFQAYLDASSRLDTVIRTSASVASAASFKYGKVDTKGVFKEASFKQVDGLYMNDYQTEGDFIFELFGTLMTYDKVLLVPQESKYKTRKGMIDWSIVPDDKFFANLGKGQTIDSFTYQSSSGQTTDYKYEEVIYITRNLTANNLIYAVPRLKALMATIENILGIHNFMGEYIASGGKSSIVASSDSLLSEEQSRAVKRSLQEFLGTNKPKALLLNSEKFSLNKVSDSLSTAGVLEIMAELSNEICKSFNMPAYLLGEYSSSTQGTTMQLANRTWFQIQLKPLFNTLSAAFTRYYRDYGGIKNAKVIFDYSQIDLLEDSDKEKLDIVDGSIKIGIMSINEGRIKMGQEPLPYDGAGKHFVPAYMLGQNPVAFETFDEDVARNLGDTTGGASGQGDGSVNATGTDTATPSGTGGDNNTTGLGGSA